MENRSHHLQLIQCVISRMASNSFMLKGWSVTLVSALFALAASEANHRFAALAYFPALVFWSLDGYFLDQERRFRRLYDLVRIKDEVEIDFSMDTSVAEEEGGWSKACLSKTLVAFHVPIIVAAGVVWYFTS